MRIVKACGLLLGACILASGAGAQTYPTKPVRILTSGAGGGPDVVARLVANELSTPLGQPVVVENRAPVTLGASAAKSPPDGYTLLLWGGALWISPLLEPASYDVLRDFMPIATITRATNVLVVTPSLPVKTVADLIKLAKAKPGELNYSSSQNGSSSHLAGELFKSMAGVNIVRVSYKGGPQETADLLSGQIHMTFSDGASASTQIKAGKLRALASTSLKPSSFFPDLPTVADTLPGFVSESLLGFWAPAKTPDAIVRRLSQESVRLLDKPEVRDRLLKTGVEPVGGTPEQLNEAIKSQIDNLSKVIKDVAAKPAG